jgi:phage terminase large subunit-like protein
LSATAAATAPEQGLTNAEKAQVYEMMEERDRRTAQRLFFEMYGDEDTIWNGPSIMGGLVEPGQVLHRRDLYPKHMEFIEAEADHRETCFMAANRVGKTFGGGGYKVSAHLTGLYPDWWNGRRFEGPISAWAAGDTYETTRDIIQLTLLGEVSYNGSRKIMDGRGVIPGHLLGQPAWRSGVQDLVDKIKVRHVSGGYSTLGLKSYDQGRKAFQGTGRHVIWFDEEPPMDVYNEALIRTATLDGLIMLTFTPLSGLSEVVLSFLPKELRPDQDE